MTFGLNDVGLIYAGLQESIAQIFSSAVHILFVRRVGTDRWNAEQLHQFVDGLVEMIEAVFYSFVHLVRVLSSKVRLLAYG